MLNVECSALVKIDISKKQGNAFRRPLLRWYSHHGRDLPWRRTRDPYAVLVSEVMLQQTQVAAVLPYYKEWLRRFPNFPGLARASTTEVLHAWQGLGYYSRARYLLATARAVVDRHGGCFPKQISEMRKLSGIGKYTAHAVANFAFDQPGPIVEANTARVLARVFDLRTPIDSSAGQKILWNRADALVPKKDAATYNSALLDLGALVCLPRNPKCGICPVKKFCRAQNPESLPVKRPRPETKRLIEKHALVIKQNKILLQTARHRWRGMWILPALNESARANGASYEGLFPFTHHRITLRVFHRPNRKIDNRTERWFAFRKLTSIPIPSPHRRAINALLS